MGVMTRTYLYLQIIETQCIEKRKIKKLYSHVYEVFTSLVSNMYMSAGCPGD